jgi:hypothetical protein
MPIFRDLFQSANHQANVQQMNKLVISPATATIARRVDGLPRP